jgi:arylsulfatase A-like enzyme
VRANQTDYEIGRLLQAIKDEGKSDNTIVLWVFGDNGAAAGAIGTSLPAPEQHLGREQ